MVYNSNDFEGFNKASENSNGNLSAWDSSVGANGLKGKFFSLIPFQLESKITAKKFILRMEVFPEAKFLRLHALTLNGVQ